MEWWIWLIIVVAVLAVSVLGILAVQARRRSGGVISARDGARRDRTPPPGDGS